MTDKTEAKKTATRYYVVAPPGSIKNFAVKASSKQEAKAFAADLANWTARVAEPEDMIGRAAEDILDATKREPAK